MQVVLMVCTGNICRSPMAEYFLRSMLPRSLAGRVAARSAGVHALDGHGAAPEAIQVMRAYGIDLAPHVARSLDPAMVRSSGMILVMEPFQEEIVRWVLPAGEAGKVRLLGEFGPVDRAAVIEDPYGGPLPAYRQAAARIRECVAGLVARLTPEQPTRR